MTTNTLRNIVVALLLITTTLLSACSQQRATVVENLMQRIAEQRIGQDVTADWPDGLHAFVCGAGGPMPDPNRSGPCVLVVAGKSMLMVDAGTNGVRNVARAGIPVGDLDAVLLTHFHSDHIDGLGETGTLRWVSAAHTKPLPVIGPTGVAEVVDGFNRAYRQDTVYRHEHHGDTVAPLSGKGLVARTIPTPAAGKQSVVFNQDGLKVTMFTGDHAPVHPAVGYRFEYKGRSLLITGDTDKSTSVDAAAKGAEVLIHEALAPHLVNIMNAAAKKNGVKTMEKITFDILDYHASPVEAAETAQAAGAKHLVFYHIVPVLPLKPLEVSFLKGVSDIYNGNVTVSSDGFLISLPAGSDKITTDNLL